MRKNLIFKSPALLAALFPLMVNSCVTEEYDLTDMDMTVSFGGEHFVFPLGSTEQLTLKSLLSDNEYLKLTDGVYRLSMSDCLDFSDEIPDIASELDIKPVNVSQSLDFELGSTDLENLGLDEQKFDNQLVFNDISVPEIEIPKENRTSTVHSNLYSYLPTDEQLTFDLPSRHFEYEGLFSAPAFPVTSDEEIALPDQVPVNATLREQNRAVDVSVELADDITSVSDLELSDNAVMTISISAVNSFLKRGSITPNVTLNLGELMYVDGNKSSIVLGNDLVLNADNGYSATKTYTIDALAVDDNDWTGNTLNKTCNITMSGTAGISSDAVTTTSLLAASNTAGGMGLDVIISFENVKIKDVTMGITPITQNETVVVELGIDPVTLPEQVAGVREITLVHGSAISIGIGNENLSKMSGLSAVMNSMEITFPKEFRSSDLNADNVYQISQPGNLIQGETYNINIDAIVPSEPDAEHKISFSNEVTANISALISGTVKLSELPQNETEDPVITTDVSTNLEIEEYYLEIENIEQDLSENSFDVHFDLPDGVGNYGTFIIVPDVSQSQPLLNIDINIPDFAEMDIVTGTEGLKIHFPEMLGFKNVPTQYNYDETDNSITITGAIPDHISLDIDKLKVKPQINAETGAYYSEGTLNFSGVAVLGSSTGSGGVLTGTEANNLIDNGILINASVSAMTAESVTLDHFETEIDETFAFDLISFDDLPEQVKSIDQITLDNTVLNISISTANLPEMGNDAVLDLAITIPQELLIEDTRIDANHVLHIHETIGAGDATVEIDPITISGVDLSSTDIENGEGMLSFDMVVEGGVSVENPSVEVHDLSGTVNVNVDANIPEINISKVTGIVDYELANMNQSVDLSSLPDFLRGEEICLDFVNPHITIAVNSNVGIPVKANIDITPYIDGEASSETAISIKDLTIPEALSADEVKETKFWIGDDRKGVPQDYVFVQAGIKALLSKIPEKLDIVINGGTDSDSQNLHVIEPNANYSLKMDYEVAIPMYFGKDLNIVLRDTMDISGMGSTMARLLEDSELGVGGEVISSLPLEMELELALLDENDKPIHLAKTPVQTIYACNSDGTPSSSPLDMGLVAAPDSVFDTVKSIEMKFTITSPNLTDIPITDESFLQAILKLSVPGGVTVDLSALGTPENTDEQ